MRITLSERQFTEQIRQLEGLGSDVTLDEITHRMDRYARKLFVHLQGYGVQMLAGVQVNGTLATMQASLKQSRSEEDVQMRIQGLALLAPVSVSLDQPDLSAFVVNPVMLASMIDNWSAFSASLQRILLDEVRPALENAAQQLMSAPMAPPSNDFEQEIFNLEYDAFLAAAGKKDPLRKHREIEEFNRQEIAAAQAAQAETDRRKWERD